MIHWKTSGAVVAAVAAFALGAAPAYATTYSNGIGTFMDNQGCNSGDVAAGLADAVLEVGSPDGGFACGNLDDDPTFENGILRADENQICNSGDVAAGVLAGVGGIGSPHGPFLCDNGSLIDGLPSGSVL